MTPCCPRHSHRRILTVAITTLLLAACGGGVEEETDAHDHDAVSIDTAGRLVSTEQNARTLRVHDLDNNTVESTLQADNLPSGLYASPGGRYAVVMQRTQGLVQFFDGGIWQEDHGDHLHDYKQASRAMPWKLNGVQPTHFDVQAGKQAAIFMDGNAASTPAQSAGVRLITDASIAAGGTLASVDLGFPIHGLAEPRDDKLLAVARAADAGDALPTHLTLHQREGASYRLDRQLPTRCNGMHGSASSGAYTVVGCADGMLLVKHLGATTVDDGSKLATPLRVGTIAGHPRLPGHFIGVASEGAAPGPVTTRFYAVNGDAATVADFVPQGWETGRVRRAHAFDRSGQRFFILDDQGTLVAAQRQGSGWAPLARLGAAIPTMPSTAPFPVITANGARDELYITDPVARQLVVVNSLSGAVTARRDLGFTPSNLVWIGITR